MENDQHHVVSFNLEGRWGQKKQKTHTMKVQHPVFFGYVIIKVLFPCRFFFFFLIDSPDESQHKNIQRKEAVAACSYCRKGSRLIKEYRVDRHELWSPSTEPIETAESLVQKRFSSAFFV